MDLGPLARLQGGVFTRDQARRCGFNDRQVTAALASGRWRQYFSNRRGVLADVTLPTSSTATIWAATLAVGEPCALGLSSAAALWGWCDPPDRVHVVVPLRRRPTAPPGTRVYRLELNGKQVSKRRGLPVTARARTLADCLRFLPLRLASDVLDRSQQLGGPSLGEVASIVPRHGLGTAQARRILRAADRSTFAAEKLAVSLLKAAAISGWKVNYEVQLNGRKLFIDLAFPELGIAIEIDGFAFHSKPMVFRGDRKRQNAVVMGRWKVLRYTWVDLVEEPERFIEEVRQMIDAASASAAS